MSELTQRKQWANAAFQQHLEISPAEQHHHPQHVPAAPAHAAAGQGGLRALGSKVPPDPQGLDTSPPHPP